MTGISAHIPLEGACNARDLGGYITPWGETARFAFIRCETPYNMTPADVGVLLGLGVACVIDLRGPDELEREPNPFAKIAGVQYHNIPLFDGGAVHLLSSGGGMADFYVYMLDNHMSAFAQVFRAALESRGGVLFHCSAGKDRTGLVAALLLLNAGAQANVAVDEYLISQALLGPWIERQVALAAARGISLDTAMLEAREEYISTAIAHIESVYGGAAGYLRAAGLAPDEIDALGRRVVWGS